jgi:hypothetical protein
MIFFKQKMSQVETESQEPVEPTETQNIPSNREQCKILYEKEFESKLAFKKKSIILEKIKYEEFIKEIKAAPLVKPKNTRHRYLIHNFAILKVDDKEFVIPKKEENEPNPRIFLYKEEMFDKVYDEHCSQGHRGRDLMNKHCATRYANVTIEIINLILKFCMECIKKKQKKYDF